MIPGMIAGNISTFFSVYLLRSHEPRRCSHTDIHTDTFEVCDIGRKLVTQKVMETVRCFFKFCFQAD